MMYIGLAAIAVVVAVLMLSDGGERIGGVVEADQFAGIAWTGMILLLVVAGFWRQFTGALGENLRNLAVWVLIGLACLVGYSYRDQIQGVSSRVMGDLRPGSSAQGPDGTVTITRRRDGDFQVEAEVNGKTQSFAFDTGASAVVLTAENAAALGIRPAESAFTVRVSTANGPAFTAPILLDSIRVGPITERRVDALVSRPGALRVNLLGQSFLGRLSSYEVRGDRLILQAP